MTLQLRVEDLNFSYKEDTNFCLKHINFSASGGDIISVCGKIGSGKSTLLYALKGVLKFDGKACLDFDGKTESLKYNSGLLMQCAEDQLFGHTVSEDVGFSLANFIVSAEEKALKIQNAIEGVGLNFKIHAHQNIYALSGGQRRLVALAGTIVLQPKVLLLDEPFIMLDRSKADEIIKMLKEYAVHNNAIVILASHDDAYVHLSNKTLVLNEGAQVYFGDTDKLYFDTNKLHLLGIKVPDIYTVLINCDKNGIKIKKPFTVSNIAKQIAEVQP